MGQSAIGGIFQGVGSVQQGKANYVAIQAEDAAQSIALGDAKLQAQQVELAAAQREADRKEALNRALSSQNAMVGASGVTGAGSPFAVAEADIAAANEAGQRDKFMSDLEARSIRYRGITQRRFARVNKKIQGFSAFHSMVSQAGGAAGSAAGGME